MSGNAAGNPPAASLEPPFAPDIFRLPPPYSISRPDSSSSNGSSQSDSDASDAGLLNPDDSLPTIFGKGNNCELVETDINEFLKLDLDLERLNRIQHLLWMAGRPMRARPLHRYKLMGLEVLQTLQMDLHLLKYSNRLLVKPLPEYFLSHAFWTKHICPYPSFHASASGFLLSYIWLLTSPLDLQLAHDLYLVPKSIKWPVWKAFVRDFSTHIDMTTLHQVNQRYQFGDLRLGRINSIYRTRFAFTHFVRGYLYPYNRYVVFFQRNFGWILVVFVFFSLVLGAMQVGVSVSPLQEDEAFRKSTYGFVVFSILSVAVILALVGVVFAVVFFFNMAAAISHDNDMRRKRAEKARLKKNEEA